MRRGGFCFTKNLVNMEFLLNAEKDTVYIYTSLHDWEGNKVKYSV